jgi:hypothetical protein
MGMLRNPSPIGREVPRIAGRMRGYELGVVMFTGSERSRDFKDANSSPGCQ